MAAPSYASVIERADEVARRTLRPAAESVDTSTKVPASHLDALAEAGLFGTVLADDPVRATMQTGERLAAACLSTTFVWAQHQGALMRLLRSSNPQRDRWLSPALRGEITAGVSFGGLPTHGESLHIRDGALVGVAPFITAWSTIDLLVLWASDPSDGRIYCIAMPEPRTASIAFAERLDLIACNASDTYRVTFDGWPVERGAVLDSITRAEGESVPLAVRRHNSTLGLGLLRGIVDDSDDPESPFAARLSALRDKLDAAMDEGDDAMTNARGELLATVMSAAQTLYLAGGGRSAAFSSLGSRRLREAAFVQSAATLRADRAAAQRLLAIS